MGRRGHGGGAGAKVVARAALALAGGGLSMLAGAGLVACFDLLHSTSDFETACEIDASRPGCAREAEAEAVSTDFCAWKPVEATEHALHACAWLGACETPLGNNAFGPCYFRALMAYDCAANPNHPVQNEAHRLWDCLQRTKSCADVDACIFGSSPPICPQVSDLTVCVGGTPTTRVRCEDGGAQGDAQARGENCALWGQTCASIAGGGSLCAGDAKGATCEEGTGSCGVHTPLHWCAAIDGGPPRDVGIDCASYGAGACVGLLESDAGYASWTACAPADAGPSCTLDASATCDDAGRALSCPTGVVETIDCARLLNQPAGCVSGALDPQFDWTGPCTLVPSQCPADSCDRDGGLTSCERGAGFSVDCASEGLGACALVTAEPGAPARAACAPPAAR
ncbi:MAG TPA: hypothetical protein VHV30_15235 [Polyangiaceae bacterium]|jgi:hypothetical protein|nr:hypothetical protein [Polyangiaceae bacterium]